MSSADLTLDRLIDAALQGPEALDRLLSASQVPASIALMAALRGDPGPVLTWLESHEGPLAGLVAALALRGPGSGEPTAGPALLARVRANRPQAPTAAWSALALCAEAELVGQSADVVAFDLAMQVAIAALPDGCGLREVLLKELALRLALEGALHRLSGVLDLPPEDAPLSVYPADLIAPCFIDAIECGRVGQAQILAPALPPSGADALLDPYRLLLPRLADQLLGLGAAEPVVADPRIQAVDLLARGDAQALTELADLAGRLDGGDLLDPIGFLSWTGVRCALALGDADLAASLLDRRVELGRRSPLDGLFRARLAVLRGQARVAADMFAAVEAHCASHASGRLECELAWSIELTRRQLAALGTRLGQVSVPTIAPGALAAVVATGEALEAAPVDPTIVGLSPAINAVRERLRQPWPVSTDGYPLPVLIHGPEGSGKHHVARCLQAASDHASSAWLDCRTLPEAEALELLVGRHGKAGDSRGLLERLGDRPLVVVAPELAKTVAFALLVAIEDGSWQPLGGGPRMRGRPRCIVVCNRPDHLPSPLRSALAADELSLPALAERPADVIELARHFLRRRWGSEIAFAPDALDLLTSSPWPGNVRQLRQVCDRLACSGVLRAILADDLSRAIAAGADGR